MGDVATYNFKRVDNLPVVSRGALRRGQAALYDTLVDRVNTGMPITLEEATHIWKTKVSSKVYDGVPHRTDYYAEKVYDDKGELTGWRTKEVPMTKEEIVFAVLNWLTRNIGILVMRGYLKVIPMIQLEPANNSEEDKR